MRFGKRRIKLGRVEVGACQRGGNQIGEAVVGAHKGEADNEQKGPNATEQC